MWMEWSRQFPNIMSGMKQFSNITQNFAGRPVWVTYIVLHTSVLMCFRLEPWSAYSILVLRLMVLCAADFSPAVFQTSYVLLDSKLYLKLEISHASDMRCVYSIIYQQSTYKWLDIFQVIFIISYLLLCMKWYTKTGIIVLGGTGVRSERWSSSVVSLQAHPLCK